MECQHPKHDVLLHHAYDAILDHAHELDVARYGLRLELVDPGADGKEHFQISKPRDVVGRVPGYQVPYLFRLEAFAGMIELEIRSSRAKACRKIAARATSELKRNAIDVVLSGPRTGCGALRPAWPATEGWKGSEPSSEAFNVHWAHPACCCRLSISRNQ